MVFKRVWDSSCPRVWDTWKGDNGVTWVIRDLLPQDDEEALQMLVETLCADEVLCSYSNLLNDEESVRSISDFWRGYISQRMTLACYEEKDGRSTLAGLNLCVVICEWDKPNNVIEGKAWKNVYAGLEIFDKKVDPFKYLGIDKVLYALGLVVRREYRGAGLGSRILAAREPLALYHGIKGTSTVFTGPASQKSAERAGFSTALALSLKNFVEDGMDYPSDETKIVKLMVKKFV